MGDFVAISILAYLFLLKANIYVVGHTFYDRTNDSILVLLPHLPVDRTKGTHIELRTLTKIIL